MKDTTFDWRKYSELLEEVLMYKEDTVILVSVGDGIQELTYEMPEKDTKQYLGESEIVQMQELNLTASSNIITVAKGTNYRYIESLNSIRIRNKEVKWITAG